MKARALPATGATFLFDVGLPLNVGLDLGFDCTGTDQVVGDTDEFTAAFAGRVRVPHTTLSLEDVPIPSTGGNAWRAWARLGLSFRWRH